jgi:hypothetical protein
MCKGSAYIIPGDVVAVGNTCGAWSYVQYIGRAHVTMGWVAATTLAPETLIESPYTAPADASTRGHHYQFKLTRGRGLPVCEAYLQRLNQTDFKQPPYCGRPESTAILGFEYLKRIWMSREQFDRLYISVNSNLENRKPEDFYVHRKEQDGRDLFGPPTKDMFPPSYAPSTWTYLPDLDIENDGVPQRVTIWNEDDRNDPMCRDSVYQQSDHPALPQSGVILQRDADAIDRIKTQEVFGHPDGGFLISNKIDGKPQNQLIPAFRAVGQRVGIMKFRGISYFDTFFTRIDLGDLQDQRRNDRALWDTLGVFVRKAHRTSQVCEYFLKDPENER